MGSWLAAMLVTPVFGLSLQLQAPAALNGGVDAYGAGTMGLVAALAAPTASVDRSASALAIALPSVATELEQAQSPGQIYKEQMRRRAALTRVHRGLGIATWGAMTATLVAGIIQYYNMYGFFAGQDSNPCVRGNAIFGQGQCSGAAWPHRITAFTTAGLYAATFTVSLMMPDPDDAASGDSEYARTLRLHKILRWVHLAGMITQMGLGLAVANNWFGLDRANDYGALQALATVHMGVGLATWGAMSWAAALMMF